MQHHEAIELLRRNPITWGDLRDHMMDTIFGDSFPTSSIVNSAIPIDRVWEIHDKAIANRPQDQFIDPNSSRDALQAANIVRDFGLPGGLR